MRIPHITIVSRSLPPMVIGTPIILYNLFSKYPGALSGIGGWLREAKVDVNLKLPFQKVAYLKSNIQIVQRVIERFQLQLFPLIQKYVAFNLKRQKPDAVFAVFPNPVYFTSAYWASKKLKIPFVVHIHDLWLENAPEGALQDFASYWEPIIMKGADLVTCTTLAQVNLYKKKYGINPILLPHTLRDEDVDANLVSKSTEHLDNQENKEVVITYTGNISGKLNLDAIQTLIKAVDLLPPNYKIQMLTSASRQELERDNLFHKRCSYLWMSKEEAFEALKNSNLLFLPLSFKESNRHEISTVYATKTLDYLISGVPIFVFSPSYAHHNELAKKEGWGQVLENNNPEELAREIISLINQSERCKELTQNAKNAAEERRTSVQIKSLIKNINTVIHA